MSSGRTLAGRRAFITAGGAGMGRATAIAMVARGAEVLTCDIDDAALAGLPDEIGRWRCDVGDGAALDDVLTEVVAGGLDILVNNAGIAGPTKPIEEIADDEWRQTMAVDLDSFFVACRRVVPVFKARGGGVIVNMASTAGMLGFPLRAPYAAAKWAIVGLTKTLAMELGPSGIRVNAIAPGAVTGDRMDRVVGELAAAEGVGDAEIRRRFTIGVSMQSFVEPEEIAELICYLCADSGRHISGQVIAVDGHTETLWPRT